VFIIFQSFRTLLAQKNKKLYKKIYVAGGIGFLIALLLPMILFVLINYYKINVNEELFEKIEGPMMIFSGTFIIMTVFVFHSFFHKKRGIVMNLISSLKPEQKLFSMGIPLVLLSLIVQEGFEIALFTSTTILMSSFVANMIGLGTGLVAAFGTVYIVSAFLSRQFRSRIITLTKWLLIGVGLFHVMYGVMEMI
jgi:hypothetical protein